MSDFTTRTRPPTWPTSGFVRVRGCVRGWLSPAIILTIGSVMTFASLFYSPEAKDLHWDEVGESTSGIEGTEFESEYGGPIAD